MPIYDYVCQKCGKPFEVRLSIAEYSERETPGCPACGSRMVMRRFTPINLALGSHTGAGTVTDCNPTDGPGCCGRCGE